MAFENNFFNNIHLGISTNEDFFKISENSDSCDGFNSEKLNKFISEDVQLNGVVDVECSENFVVDGEILDEFLLDRATPDPNFFDNLEFEENNFSSNLPQSDVEISTNQIISSTARDNELTQDNDFHLSSELQGYEVVDPQSLFSPISEITQKPYSLAHDLPSSPPQNLSNLIRKRPGRPPKDDLDVDLEIKVAEVENKDPEVIGKMKRNQSSRKYRKNKNNKLYQTAQEVEKLQEKNKRLQKIHSKNEDQIAKIYRELKRLMDKK